jgi:hypothetical protein
MVMKKLLMFGLGCGEIFMKEFVFVVFVVGLSLPVPAPGKGSEVISAVSQRFTAIYTDPNIDLLSFHAAKSVEKVNEMFDKNSRYGKPILISDDGSFWSMADPDNMHAALKHALARGGHFEHLDLDVTDREEHGLPISGIEHFSPRSIKNLQYLSQHSQSLPYPGTLTRLADKLCWNGKEVHLVGFASYETVATTTTDIEGYLDVLARYNVNFTRVFCVDRWANNGCSLTPFKLVRGDGCPGSTFDISKTNPKYFARLRKFVTEAWRRGIVVQLCIFDRCGLQHAPNKPERWSRNPYNKANNTNNFFGLDERNYPPAFTQTTGDVARLHRVLLDKIVETVGDCGNVVYEIMNEPMNCFPNIPRFHAWVAYTLREAIANKSSRIHFTDVTEIAGTPNIPELGAHSACWADINGDGWEDLYVTNIGGKPNRPHDVLYVNQANGTFVDESVARGINDHYDSGSHGAVFCDLDNDGDLDAFVSTTYLTIDYRKSRRFEKIEDTFIAYDHIYRNDGRGYFKDITSGIPEGRNTATRQVLAGDIDKDGDLDLYATNQLEDADVFGNVFNPMLRFKNFFINDGSARFAPVDLGVLFSGFTQGAVFADVDEDGDLDLAEAKWAPPSTCYLNNGHGNFTDMGASRGMPADSQQRDNGISFGDIDNDGDLDIAVVNKKVSLYRNDGRGYFSRVATFEGKGGSMVSFGDLDHDGDLDIYHSGGDIYENDGKGKFTVLPASQTGLGYKVNRFVDPRGCALADYDNDGDLDIYVGDKRGKSRLLRCNLNNSNFLKIKLTDCKGQLGALGSKVMVYDAGHVGQSDHLRGYRQVIGAYGYCAQDSPIVHFGLPVDERFDLLICYLTGEKATLLSVAPGQVLEIVGTAVRTHKTVPAS